MRIALLLMAALITIPASAADLRGHGGPIRALAILPDGETLISGSFDATVIVWSLPGASAKAVLPFHDGSVNAVAALPNGRFASAGEDGRIVLWNANSPIPERVFEGHTAPVVALAASSDGARLASASWDGTGRVWDLATGNSRVLTGHQGNVNAIAFLHDGRVATAGYDSTLRVWDDAGAAQIVTLPTPLNTIAVLPNDTLAAGGGDGKLRIVDRSGAVTGDVQIGDTPVIALTIAPDGARMAAAGARGVIALMGTGMRTGPLTLERIFVGPGLPVWSLAFTRDGRELLTGGSDRIIRSWNVQTGELAGPPATGVPADPLAAYAGDRGAQVFRACIACHALRPEDGVRAGPSLHKVMGRKIGTLPGYIYSPAFGDLDIVWTKETIARLFEIGPHAFTPGTKMPEQTVNRVEDRRALVDFLERATK